MLKSYLNFLIIGSDLDCIIALTMRYMGEVRPSKYRRGHHGGDFKSRLMSCAIYVPKETVP